MQQSRCRWPRSRRATRSKILSLVSGLPSPERRTAQRVSLRSTQMATRQSSRGIASTTATNEKVSRSIPGASSIPGPLKASSRARCESNRERACDSTRVDLADVFLGRLTGDLFVGVRPKKVLGLFVRAPQVIGEILKCLRNTQRAIAARIGKPADAVEQT